MSEQLQPKRDLEYLNKLYNQLPNQTQDNIIDILELLVKKHKAKLKAYWDGLPEVDEPLSTEEKEMLQDKEGFITGEEAKRDFNLHIDLP